MRWLFSSWCCWLADLEEGLRLEKHETGAGEADAVQVLGPFGLEGDREQKIAAPLLELVRREAEREQAAPLRSELDADTRLHFYLLSRPSAPEGENAAGSRIVAIRHNRPLITFRTLLWFRSCEAE